MLSLDIPPEPTLPDHHHAQVAGKGAKGDQSHAQDAQAFEHGEDPPLAIASTVIDSTPLASKWLGTTQIRTLTK